MRSLILLTMLFPGFCLAEGHWFAGVGLGINTSLFVEEHAWHEEHEHLGGGLRIGHRHQIHGQWYGEASVHHFSQVLIGPPFNDTNESASEHFYYWLEYRW